jgi:hypothetical protein
MKLSDSISKKTPRFFCAQAAPIFLTNWAFVKKTVTICKPASRQIFGTGFGITDESINKTAFTMAPLAGQTDFSDLTYPATIVAGTLVAGTTEAITGITLFRNVFTGAI